VFWQLHRGASIDKLKHHFPIVHGKPEQVYHASIQYKELRRVFVLRLASGRYGDQFKTFDTAYSLMKYLQKLLTRNGDSTKLRQDAALHLLSQLDELEANAIALLRDDFSGEGVVNAAYHKDYYNVVIEVVRWSGQDDVTLRVSIASHHVMLKDIYFESFDDIRDYLKVYARIGEQRPAVLTSKAARHVDDALREAVWSMSSLNANRIWRNYIGRECFVEFGRVVLLEWHGDEDEDMPVTFKLSIHTINDESCMIFNSHGALRHHLEETLNQAGESNAS